MSAYGETLPPADVASESPAVYGTRKKFRGQKITVGIDERKKLPPPSPAEPDYVAELLAEAERREKARPA